MPCSWGFNKLVIKPVESQSSNTWQLIVADSCIGLYQLDFFICFIPAISLHVIMLKILISQSIQLSNIREPIRVRRIASLAEKSCWMFFTAHPSPRNLTIIGITSPSVHRTQDLYAYMLILKVSTNHIKINIIFWVIKCKDQPQPQPAGVICITAGLHCTVLITLTPVCVFNLNALSIGLTTYRTISYHPFTELQKHPTKMQNKIIGKKKHWC